MADRDEKYLDWAERYEPSASTTTKIAMARHLREWVGEDDLRFAALRRVFAGQAAGVEFGTWAKITEEAAKIREYLRP